MAVATKESFLPSTVLGGLEVCRVRVRARREDVSSSDSLACAGMRVSGEEKREKETQGT